MKKRYYHLLLLFALPLIIPFDLVAQTERLGGPGESSQQSSSIVVDVITDGSFEAGPGGGAWTEFSSTFGTPICDLGACGNGTGTGPNTGAFWTWFGGIAASEEGSVTQNVIIGASGSATLTFFKEQITCDSADDFMEVTVNGTQEYLVDGSDASCGVLGYAMQSVNLDAYATLNLAPVTLEFHSEIFATNGGGSNFFIDDVVLDDTLPVELTSFTARQSGNSLAFSWKTASESENLGFEVQHSFDRSEFQTIQFVEGSGTTTEANEYGLTINDLETGVHAFRLKQIDYDGSFEYSRVIETAVTQPDQIWLDDVYPNPFNPSTQVKFMVPSEQEVSVHVYDSFGRQVRTLFNAVAQADLPYQVRFEATDLPSGVYHILVSGQNDAKSKTVTLLR